MAIRSLLVTRTKLRTTFDTLGITQSRVAQLFGVGPRSVRRWQRGDRRVPCGVDLVFRLLAMQVVTIAQVEEAAVSISAARMNGGGQPGPLVPRLVEPVPEQPTSLADSGPTTAEKVWALEPNACRWPCGDPRHLDFHFCARPVAKGFYCEEHGTMAYLAPPPGSGHGAVRMIEMANRGELHRVSLALP
jgi:hypothetical protein